MKGKTQLNRRSFQTIARFWALSLILSLTLPNSAFALRVSESNEDPARRTSLEKTLRGRPAAGMEEKSTYRRGEAINYFGSHIGTINFYDADGKLFGTISIRRMSQLGAMQKVSDLFDRYLNSLSRREVTIENTNKHTLSVRPSTGLEETRKVVTRLDRLNQVAQVIRELAPVTTEGDLRQFVEQFPLVEKEILERHFRTGILDFRVVANIFWPTSKPIKTGSGSSMRNERLVLRIAAAPILIRELRARVATRLPRLKSKTIDSADVIRSGHVQGGIVEGLVQCFGMSRESASRLVKQNHKPLLTLTGTIKQVAGIPSAGLEEIGRAITRWIRFYDASFGRGLSDEQQKAQKRLEAVLLGRRDETLDLLRDWVQTPAVMEEIRTSYPHGEFAVADLVRMIIINSSGHVPTLWRAVQVLKSFHPTDNSAERHRKDMEGSAESVLQRAANENGYIFEENLRRSRSMAVIPVVNAEAARKAGWAAAKRGIIPEITFRGEEEEVLRAIRELSEDLRDAGIHMAVAAGSVLTADQVGKAVDAGATIIVSPGLIDQVVDAAQNRKVMVIPGVGNLREALRAHERYGLNVLKFFPFSFDDVSDLAKALKAPLPPGLRSEFDRQIMLIDPKSPLARSGMAEGTFTECYTQVTSVSPVTLQFLSPSVQGFDAIAQILQDPKLEGVRFIPTGGIKPDQIADLTHRPEILAVGLSVSGKDPDQDTEKLDQIHKAIHPAAGLEEDSKQFLLSPELAIEKQNGQTELNLKESMFDEVERIYGLRQLLLSGISFHKEGMRALQAENYDMAILDFERAEQAWTDAFQLTEKDRIQTENLLSEKYPTAHAEQEPAVIVLERRLRNKMGALRQLGELLFDAWEKAESALDFAKEKQGISSLGSSDAGLEEGIQPRDVRVLIIQATQETANSIREVVVDTLNKAGYEGRINPLLQIETIGTLPASGMNPTTVNVPGRRINRAEDWIRENSPQLIITDLNLTWTMQGEASQISRVARKANPSTKVVLISDPKFHAATDRQAEKMVEEQLKLGYYDQRVSDGEDKKAIQNVVNEHLIRRLAAELEERVQIKTLDGSRFALFPVDSVETTSKPAALHLYYHNSISRIKEILPWDSLVSDILPTDDSEKANELLREISKYTDGNDGLTRLIALDHAQQEGLRLPQKHPVVFLLSVNTLDRLNGSVLAAYLAQQNALVNLILDLTAGTIQQVTLGERKYYAIPVIDLSA